MSDFSAACIVMSYALVWAAWFVMFKPWRWNRRLRTPSQKAARK